MYPALAIDGFSIVDKHGVADQDVRDEYDSDLVVNLDHVAHVGINPSPVQVHANREHSQCNDHHNLAFKRVVPHHQRGENESAQEEYARQEHEMGLVSPLLTELSHSASLEHRPVLFFEAIPAPFSRLMPHEQAIDRQWEQYIYAQ